MSDSPETKRIRDIEHPDFFFLNNILAVFDNFFPNEDAIQPPFIQSFYRHCMRMVDEMKESPHKWLHKTVPTFYGIYASSFIGALKILDDVDPVLISQLLAAKKQRDEQVYSPYDEPI